MPRRLVRVALFAVAAAVAAWAAWPDSSVLHAAADQFGLIATVLLLAGLPLLARRFFGPLSDGRIARFLRVALYHREQIASVSTEVYVVVCIAFPVIGLIMGALGVAGVRPGEAPAEPVAAA